MSGMKALDESWLSTASVKDLVDHQASVAADSPFLLDVSAKCTLNFVQLQSEVQAVASFIRSQGVKRGDSVAYAMHNGRCCAVSILGIMYGGFRAVAINLVAGRDVIAYVLSHSRTRLILTQTECLPLLEPSFSSDEFIDEIDVPVVVNVDNTTLDDWLAKNQELTSGSAKPASDALLMYTSGTTGRPKGVTLSHSNVIAGGSNVVSGHSLLAHDRALCVLPLYHINGLCVTLFGPLVAAGSVVMPQRFSTSSFWQLIDDYRCTWFSVVPTQIAYLLRDAKKEANRPFSRQFTAQSESDHQRRSYLRFGRSASAPLSPDVHGAFENQFSVPLIETMGLTETAAQILSNPMPPGERKLGSAGLPVGNDVIIVDEQFNELSAGVEGELVVRGPNVMQRYFRNEAATGEALVHNGWLRTGDLGCKDEDGYLFITGRLKELIIKGGENIAPREIDDALYQHADVVEAAAFACPCENFGQRVEAAVSLKQDSHLSESDLIDLCIERVGKFKCPDRIHFLSELPKGPSGKIQRQKIRSMVSAS